MDVYQFLLSLIIVVAFVWVMNKQRMVGTQNETITPNLPEPNGTILKNDPYEFSQQKRLDPEAFKGFRRTNLDLISKDKLPQSWNATLDYLVQATNEDKRQQPDTFAYNFARFLAQPAIGAKAKDNAIDNTPPFINVPLREPFSSKPDAKDMWSS